MIAFVLRQAYPEAGQRKEKEKELVKEHNGVQLKGAIDADGEITRIYAQATARKTTACLAY